MKKLNLHDYICTYPSDVQKAIQTELEALEELSKEDVERAMSSRLVDLEDTIDITKYVQRA